MIRRREEQAVSPKLGNERKGSYQDIAHVLSGMQIKAKAIRTVEFLLCFTVFVCCFLAAKGLAASCARRDPLEYLPFSRMMNDFR